MLGACSTALLTSGCATLTKGTSQTITINTDPPGAVCTLTRDAKPLAVVNPTPGSIPIEKAKGTVAILCKRPSYLDADGALESEFQAVTFGNILFGGLIGIVVDAASGAMHQYPTMITIQLIPEQCPTVSERDAFFDKMKATLLVEVAEVKERIGKSCREDQFQSQLGAADAGAKAKLAEIEQKRALAKTGT
ncbi:MAG TPA: hypothetical protein VGL25_04410 [Casimicrobiaceae bacterium]|jgi:hypothetical protein